MSPTPKCKSATCTNSATKNKNVRFHKFPSNNVVCAAWIRACQQPEIFSAKHSAMCENHFLPSDYAGKCHFILVFSSLVIIRLEQVIMYVFIFVLK